MQVVSQARRTARAAAIPAVLICELLWAPLGGTQVETGRLVGRISDQQVSVVSRANVKATNVNTNIVQEGTTNSTGEFVITPVAAGTYTLSVTAQGFQTVTTAPFEVQVGQIVREDLSLNIGAATTMVKVTTEAPLLSTDSATMGTVNTNQHTSVSSRDFQFALKYDF